ncbi:hypothetical protein [Roseibium sp. SCP14]|uniref:hypothetical protein n=1 Tax=Roseibium sp. SCP14 TaxID=3141375 RepID=UPI00333AAF59
MNRILAAGVGVALCAAPVSAEEPFSWTGSYDGFVVCDHVKNGVPSTFGRALELHFVQEGDVLHIATGIDDPTIGTGTSLYHGLVMSSPDGDFTSGFIESCKSRFPYKELIRIFPAGTQTGKFGFSASTVFVSDSLPGSEGALVVESCRWSATRISTEEPKIQRCDTPPSAR